MNKDTCSRCKWSKKIDENHLYCPMPSCVEYRFRTREEVLQPEKQCDTCRKRKTCARSNIVMGCRLYSPANSPRTCFECGTTYRMQEHHLFGGPCRKLSDREGLTIDLCVNDHLFDKRSIHNDPMLMKKWHQIGQKVYEEAYGKGSFIEVFRKNYL